MTRIYPGTKPSPGDIGDPISGGTAGSVLFIDSDGNFAEDNPAFTYDGSEILTPGLNISNPSANNDIQYSPDQVGAFAPGFINPATGGGIGIDDEDNIFLLNDSDYTSFIYLATNGLQIESNINDGIQFRTADRSFEFGAYTGGTDAHLDFSNIATSEKTFTFPNTTGTIALTSDNVEDFNTTFTAGSIVFSDGTNLAEDNSNLFYDDTNNEALIQNLGVGNAVPSDNPNFTPRLMVDKSESADFTVDGDDVTSLVRLIKSGGSSQGTLDIGAKADGTTIWHNGQDFSGRHLFVTRRGFSNDGRWSIENDGTLKSQNSSNFDIASTEISGSTGNIGVGTSTDGEVYLKVNASIGGANPDYGIVIGNEANFAESNGLLMVAGAPATNAMFASKNTASNGVAAFRLYNDDDVRLAFNCWGSARSQSNLVSFEADSSQSGSNSVEEMRIQNHDNSPLTFYTNDTERMRIVGGGDVGINETSPNATLDVNGGFAANIVTKTANYTATKSDYTILCDTSSNDITITLPAASGAERRIYHIKKTDTANTVTVDANSTETIDGDETKEIIGNNVSITIQSDGNNWFIL